MFLNQALLLLEILGILTIFIGWGWLALTRLPKSAGVSADSFHWFEIALAGAPAAYLASAVIVLFMPLSGSADLGFAGVGLAGFFLAVRRKGLDLPWLRTMGTLWGPILVVIAWGASYAPMNYDAGLYYLPYARFIESNPLGLGLANVHVRFGFNNALLPLSAAFRGPLFQADGFYLVGPALAAVVLGATLDRLRERWRERSLGADGLFALFGMAAWFAIIPTTAFSWFGLSPSGDLTAGLFVFFASLTALTWLSAHSSGDTQGQAKCAILLPITIAFAVAVKISSAPILLLGGLFILLRGTVFSAPEQRRSVRAGLIGAAVVLSVWGLHSIMLSGCLLFPASGSCLDFLPWTVDPAVPDGLNKLIRAYARAPGWPLERALSGWDWLAAWRTDMLAHRPFLFTLLAALPLLTAAALAMRFALKDGPARATGRAESWGVPWVFGTQAAGLSTAFLGAPDPRFAIGFLVGFTACAATWIAAFGASYQFTETRARLVARLFVCTFGGLLLWLAWPLVQKSGEPGMAWRNVQSPAIREMGNSEGFKIAVPASGDQCWEVQDLCAPHGFTAPNLAKHRLLDMAMYTSRGPDPLQRTSQSSLMVRFPADFPGVERTIFQGKELLVHWLPKESRFIVENESGPVNATIQVTVAGFATKRSVWLEYEGQQVTGRQAIEKSLWEGGAVQVMAAVNLKPGQNEFKIVSDGDAALLSPVRPVHLLLVKPLKVIPLP